MSVRIQRSERASHVVLRLSAGEILPDSLEASLRDARVTCGWLRASGVLADVELRAFDAEIIGPGSARRLAGPVQVVSLEGGIGAAPGEDDAPRISMRALIAREGDRGLETLAGEIVSAKILALEAFVTSLDDVMLGRSLDPSAGVSLFASAGAQAPARGPSPAASPPPPAASAAGTAWSAALEASEEPEAFGAPPGRDRPGGSRPGGPTVPQRPRPIVDLDSPVPEAGDVVDHFAFGRCDVLKSDGERLHLKVHKDGRIREIALEMLRVTRLEDSGPKHRFKLERRL